MIPQWHTAQKRGLRLNSGVGWPEMKSQTLTGATTCSLWKTSRECPEAGAEAEEGLNSIWPFLCWCWAWFGTGSALEKHLHKFRHVPALLIVCGWRERVCLGTYQRFQVCNKVKVKLWNKAVMLGVGQCCCITKICFVHHISFVALMLFVVPHESL